MTRRSKYPEVQMVEFTQGFWKDRIKLNREHTIPHIYRMLQEHGRIQGWDLAAGDLLPDLRPHRFWDSDCTKWIEAAAYSLARVPDAVLEAQVDDLIARMARAQQPDGYINMVGIIEDPAERWSNLRDNHELYCAGHLIEAAIAYEQATGKTLLRQIAENLITHIDARIGPEEGKIPGYPGHPEIEWALLRYYQQTGDKRSFKLAGFFIDKRGQKPYFYIAEAEARQEDTTAYFLEKIDYRYLQGHEPVRNQDTAEGHAVRATYLYTAMAAYARHKGDHALHQACKRIWQNITEKRMYLTGGIGSTCKGERFTVDYDLPNEQAYCETCAAIGLIFFAREMFRLDPKADYVDVIERALFNAVLPGVSLDGKSFFYDNPLAVHPPYATFAHRWPDERYPWHGCACCPPNLARLLASLDQIFVNVAGNTIYILHYTGFRTILVQEGQEIELEMATAYPWQGNGSLRVSLKNSKTFTLALRKPGWSPYLKLTINGEPTDYIIENGFAIIRRSWKNTDILEWVIGCEAQWLEAHPAVRHNSGQVALQRGPIVYCLEECDHSGGVTDLHVHPHDPLTIVEEQHGGRDWHIIRGTAYHRNQSDWEGQLYRPVGQSRWQKSHLQAIPYFMWGNRKPGSMRVWLPILNQSS